MSRLPRLTGLMASILRDVELTREEFLAFL